MPSSPKSRMLRKSGKRYVVPKDEPKPDSPINDGPEKWGAQSENPEHGELTVSPFRMLLPYRPRQGSHVPTEKTRQAVMYASGLGMKRTMICALLGITEKVLNNHYEEELAISRALMMNDIQTNLYNIARDPKHKGSVSAGMYLLSRLAGDDYKDRKAVELTGKDGKPIEVDQSSRTIDPTLLSAEQRDALREIMMSAMKLASPQNAEKQEEGVTIEGDYELNG